MVNHTTNACVFRIFCPDAQRVNLVGEFNAWSASATPMRQVRPGQWEARLTLAPGEYRFRYLIDGRVWLTDYTCGKVVPNAHASWDSLLTVKQHRPSPRRRSQAPAMDR